MLSAAKHDMAAVHVNIHHGLLIISWRIGA